MIRWVCREVKCVLTGFLLLRTLTRRIPDIDFQPDVGWGLPTLVRVYANHLIDKSDQVVDETSPPNTNLTNKESR